LDKILPLNDKFDISQYGALPVNKDKYPLYSVKTKNWDTNKPNALVTGGVHGYETSGVQGAIMFIHEKMEHYSKNFNIMVCPCLSPWGYEHIQRFTANAVDPNRCFAENFDKVNAGGAAKATNNIEGPCDEASLVM